MSIARILKTPLYVAQLATGAKSFEANPVIGSRRLNERGLHRRRVEIAMRLAERRRRSLGGVTDAQRAEYAERGFVRVENFLSHDAFAAVTRELEGAFRRHDMIQGRTVTRRAMIDDADLRERPALRAARDDRRLRSLMRHVASHAGEPLVTLQIVLAEATGDAAAGMGGGPDPQTMLHADTFHPTAKAWLFLRDVGPEDGPFAYVPGSHRMTPERMDWEEAIAAGRTETTDRYARRGSLRVRADELAGLGYGAPEAMTVPANTLVVADTHGFHARSASPRATTRVEVYGSLRRNPFVPVNLPSPAALPGLRGRTNRVVIDGLRLMQRVGLKASPWHDAGVGPVDEWPALLGGHPATPVREDA